LNRSVPSKEVAPNRGSDFFLFLGVIVTQAGSEQLGVEPEDQRGLKTHATTQKSN